MANAPRSLVNETVGQFQIKDELGRGGMAVVYKGYQPSLDRWVAIKTLPAEMAGDRDMVSRFHREAEAMVTLNHSNIVQIIDKGQDKGLYYFAMEFVEGPSLKDLLKQESLSMDLLFDVCTQVCEGLAYAHKKGIVHRDIKPANILYEKSTGLAKVADFGIARVTDKEMDMITLTAANVGMGTMNYMAPEQKTDAKTVDHRADIYSLGVMIYEMFTGKLPLGRFKSPSELNSKLPRKLDEVVSKCLEADPVDRYQQMDDLRVDLLAARESSKGGTLVRSVRDAAERTLTAFAGERGGGKGRLAACCLLFAVLGVGGGGAFVVVDPMKLDLLSMGGGQTTETPPLVGTETPPVTATETPPVTATETPPVTATETPPVTATETPPVTATETPPVTATETPPVTATEAPPVTATETPSVTATEKPPVATTERPVETATEKPPVTTTEQPAVKGLSAAQLARFNSLAAELEREVLAFEAAAHRVGLTSLDEAAHSARAAGEGAAKLKDEGSPQAVVTLERARDALRHDARGAFAGLIEELRGRVRAEGGDPAELQRIDDDYGRLGAKTPAEQARGWGDVVNRLHGLRVGRLTREARLALDLAALRVTPDQLEAPRRRLDAAVALEAAAAAVALEQVRAEVVALEGPTPEGLKEVTKDFIARVTNDTDNPYFYTLCPAPGQRAAALGPFGGQKMLFLLEVSGGKVSIASRAAVPLANPALIAPAGGDAFWVAELNGSTVHRFLVTRDRLVEEATIDVRGTKVMDLDVAPDGTLWVATLRDVRSYRDGSSTGAASMVERDFCDVAFVPRRVAALVGGGWALTGHVPVSDGMSLWGDPEVNDEWALTMRALLPGDAAPRQLQPRGKQLLAVAGCGAGLLAVQHRNQGGGDFYLMSSRLDPNPTPLPLRGHRPELAQDVAVSGRLVYVLEKAVARPVPQFRRRLAVYEMD